MTTTVPSGLGTTLGYVKEGSGYGSETTVTRWLLIDAGESLGLKKNVAQSNALNGSRSRLSKRRVLPTVEAGGAFSADLVDKGLGAFFQNLLGSAATAVQVGGTAAYLQQHVPGTTLVGFSMNLQKGIPETPTGTIVPLSYPGTKILDMEISCQVNEIAKMTVTVDSQFEDTAASYAAPTFPTPNVIHFAGPAASPNTFLLGGTVTTGAGVISGIAGSAAPTGIVTKVTCKITNKLNVARFNIGAGKKSEPVENEFIDVMGDIEIEFANLTDYYNAMAADTVTALQINLYGPLIAAANYAFVQIWVPAARFEDASPKATSTDVVKVSVPWTGLNDGVDPICQVNYQSVDTSV